MKTCTSVLYSVAVLWWGSASASAAQLSRAGGGVEGRLTAYLANYLPYDPASKITVEKAPMSGSQHASWLLYGNLAGN